MSKTSIARIKELNRISKDLSTLMPKYSESVAAPSCDKHNLAFGGDSRFSVFNTNVFLDCHTGYYGNSSCSTYMNVDNVIASRLLDKALNKNMKLILDDMAKFAFQEAAELTVEAEKELAEMQKSIDEAKAFAAAP